MRIPHNRLAEALKCALLALLLFPVTVSDSLAWGPGVHAYIADQIAKKAGWKNVDEMYGSMAPDVINYMFSSPYLSQMYAATHFDFEPLWEEARTVRERALAHGFVMHNNAWAADYTAHNHSLTLADSAQGYVVQKAEILAAVLESDPAYASLGIPHQITVEICHPMIENSVELLMAQVDRELGQKVVLAVTRRSDVFPWLLARAYAPLFAQYFGNSELSAAEALVTAEAAFRQITLLQGNTLQQELLVALDQMAELNAQLAVGFLSQYGVVLPEGFDVKGLITNLIGGGMVLCQGDFQEEVLATVQAVGENMTSNGHGFPQY